MLLRPRSPWTPTTWSSGWTTSTVQATMLYSGGKRLTSAGPGSANCSHSLAQQWLSFSLSSFPFAPWGHEDAYREPALLPVFILFMFSTQDLADHSRRLTWTSDTRTLKLERWGFNMHCLPALLCMQNHYFWPHKIWRILAVVLKSLTHSVTINHVISNAKVFSYSSCYFFIMFLSSFQVATAEGNF